MDIESIARVCHEVNRGYCESLGDFSQSPWKDAQKCQRESAIHGVKFHIESPEVTPKQSHENWLNGKQGWKHGPVKDPEKREHPCYLPYDELPQEQRSKDYIFTAIVKTLLSL